MSTMNNTNILIKYTNKLYIYMQLSDFKTCKYTDRYVSVFNKNYVIIVFIIIKVLEIDLYKEKPLSSIVDTWS